MDAVDGKESPVIDWLQVNFLLTRFATGKIME
jgi:hypothetical protein